MEGDPGRDSCSRFAREGFNVKKNSFVQAYGSDELDAALLQMPLVGFLPGRIRGCRARWRRLSAN